MNLSTLLLVVLLLTSNLAHAKPNIYMKASDSMFTMYSLVKGEKQVEFTEMSSDQELMDLFKDNKVSYGYIRDYGAYTKGFHISLWGGLGLALVYLLANSEDYSDTIYWGIFGTGFLGSIYYSGKARHSLHRAINTYNGVPEEMSFSRQKHNSPRLSYSWRF